MNTLFSPQRYFPLLLIVLLVKSMLIAWFVIAGPIGLGPDEAQYWTWSQLLDWGYYSKPPGIAWQIWLGTLLFGNTVLGVRFGSILIGFAIPIALYIFSRSCGFERKPAFWAALAFALSPLGFAASFLAITDSAMILAWTLACACFASALANEKKPSYILIGLIIAAGAIFKWPIYLLWILFIGMLPFYPYLRSGNLIAGFFISLLGLLPSIIWNIQHQWATFRHVFYSIEGNESTQPHATAFSGNPLEFLGAQAALVSPILFVMLTWAWIRLFTYRRKLPPAAFFCGSSSLFLFGLILCLSFFKKVQGNWVDFAYPTAFVFLAWYYCEKSTKGTRWMRYGTLLSICIVFIVSSIPTLQSHNLLPLSYRLNPFRHNMGWESLGRVLQEEGYIPDQHFLVGSKYQMTSILSFYGPQQKRAYFLNLHGLRQNQFSFWPSLAEEQKGKDGFYVVVENEPYLKNHLDNVSDYILLLSPYFKNVEFKGLSPLFYCNNAVAKGALIFKVTQYNGKEPTPSSLLW